MDNIGEMKPTAHFRILVLGRATPYEVLQQLWQNSVNGEEEWREVRKVYNHDLLSQSQKPYSQIYDTNANRNG